jgi:hypothetical protein
MFRARILVLSEEELLSDSDIEIKPAFVDLWDRIEGLYDVIIIPWTCCKKEWYASDKYDVLKTVLSACMTPETILAFR